MPAVGRYSLTRKIAGGGMAEIYLGTQHGAVGFERPVVVKAIHSEHSTEPHFRNMLIDEAHIAMSLTHSNIAQVLDLGVAGGRFFLILELVDGWDLDHLLRRAQAAQFPLPASLALHIVVEVCRALAYAHTKARQGKPLGIVHRDVSPHNVLVSEHGEVKLTDFGIAIASDRKEKTVSGFVKGKIGFMSPEQASGEPLDARSDLFALATVLYVLLTGQRPFASDSELESLLRTKEARFTPPAEAAPGMAPELAALIERAMRRHPAERFADAEEMLGHLERVGRTVLTPAGPSELKRWLAELSTRDGEHPISQLSIPPQEVADDAILSVSAESLGAGEPPPPRAATPSPPPPAPLPAPTTRLPGRWMLLAAAASAAVTLLVFRAPSRDEQPPHPEVSRSAPVATSTPAAPSAAVAVTAPPLPVPAPAVPSAPLDAGAAPGAPPDSGALSLRPPEHHEPAHAAGADLSMASVSDLSQSISVKLTSTPPGAQVAVERKPFGATPISIRFRPGAVYRVRFELSGYEPVERRVYISQRKDQTLDVALKRAP